VVWGEASAYKRFGAYWSQKVQLWWQQFLLIVTVKQKNVAAMGTNSHNPHRASPYEVFLQGQSPTLPPRKSAPYDWVVVGSVRWIKLTHVGFRAHVKIANAQQVSSKPSCRSTTVAAVA